jgi:hypothetical protein
MCIHLLHWGQELTERYVTNLHYLIKMFKCFTLSTWAGIDLTLLRLLTGWTVRGSNPGEGEFFGTLPVRPWVPPSLLYKGYRLILGGKAAGTWH